VIESFGIFAYEMVVELFLASALFWVMAVLAVRFSGITDATWRTRFFLLPILLPVATVPLVHMIIRPFFSMFSSPPLEYFLISSINISSPWCVVFLSIAGITLLSGAVYAWLPLVVACHQRLIWQQQCRQSVQWNRCRSVLDAVASRLCLPPPRLILSKDGDCGTLSLGPIGSYVAVPENLAGALDDEELESLFAHELGHIKRRDTLLGAAVGVCRSFLGFSPFCYSAYHSFARAREEAVDDLAVHISGRPLALASCLLKAYRLSNRCRHIISGNALISSPAGLDNRISRLLKMPPVIVRQSRWYFCLFSGVMMAGITLLLFLV